MLCFKFYSLQCVMVLASGENATVAFSLIGLLALGSAVSLLCCLVPEDDPSLSVLVLVGSPLLELNSVLVIYHCE